MRPKIRMHAYNYDHSAAHGAKWQELELYCTGFYNTETRGREGKDKCLCHLDPLKHSCMRVCECDPQKLHVSVYKNAQTIVSWLLPVFKGFYDAHAQPVSVCHTYMQNDLNAACATCINANSDWRIFHTQKR